MVKKTSFFARHCNSRKEPESSLGVSWEFSWSFWSSARKFSWSSLEVSKIFYIFQHWEYLWYSIGVFKVFFDISQVFSGTFQSFMGLFQVIPWISQIVDLSSKFHNQIYSTTEFLSWATFAKASKWMASHVCSTNAFNEIFGRVLEIRDT